MLADCEAALARLEAGVRDALRVLGVPEGNAREVEAPVVARLRESIAAARGQPTGGGTP